MACTQAPGGTIEASGLAAPAMQGQVTMLRELAWEKLHTGHWKDVALVSGSAMLFVLSQSMLRLPGFFSVLLLPVLR